jgi:hypothetical protein
MKPISETAIRLAQLHSHEVLLEALAVCGIENAKQMATDMMHDRGHVAEYGLPTRQSIAESAVSFATVTVPEMLIDTDFDEGFKPKDGETDMEYVMRVAVERALQPGSHLLEITYKLPNAG